MNPKIHGTGLVPSAWKLGLQVAGNVHVHVHVHVMSPCLAGCISLYHRRVRYPVSITSEAANLMSSYAIPYLTSLVGRIMDDAGLGLKYRIVVMVA
jgi:hypothetical protein